MRRPHDEDPSPRRTSRRGPCRPPTGACRPPGIPSTSRNTSRRQCLRGGTVRRCSPRRVVLPARCGFSPPPSTADESGAECPSALVLPALCPVRISVSSSLLAATMNQKSSLREVPQFVSWLLTGNKLLADDAQALVKFVAGDMTLFNASQFNQLGGMSALVPFEARDEVFDALRQSILV